MERKEVTAPLDDAGEGYRTSSVATHRRGERMRTYVPHPRHEARM